MKLKIRVFRIRPSSIVMGIYCAVLFWGVTTQLAAWIYFLCAAAWIFFAVIEDYKSFNKAIVNKTFLFFILFIAFFLITQLVNYSVGTAISGTFSNILLYFPFVMGMYYIYSHNRGNNLMLCYILLIILAFFAIRSFIYYTANPGSARYFVSNIEEQPTGMGGNPYALLNSVNFVSLFFLNNCFDGRGKSRRNRIIIAIISVVFSLLLCFSIDSSITTFSYIICLIVSIINGFFFREKEGDSPRTKRNNYIKMAIFYAVVLIIVMSLGGGLSSFLLWLSTVLSFTGSFFVQRLEQLAVFFQVGTLGSSMSTRFQLMGNSINTFFKYPIFGARITGVDMTSNVVGRHSEAFDLFAYYGLVSLLLYAAIFNALRFLYKTRETTRYIPIIIYLLINAVLNPMHYPQALFTLFLIVPLLIDTFSPKQNEKVTEKTVNNRGVNEREKRQEKAYI